MEYHKTVTLKDGRTCVLRNGTAQDGQAEMDIFNLTHAQTDYLLTYPDETKMSVEDAAQFLKEKTESACEIEMRRYQREDQAPCRVWYQCRPRLLGLGDWACTDESLHRVCPTRGIRPART